MLKLRVALLMICIMAMIVPQTAFAYSYGDPNKEELAEAYRAIAEKLGGQPADWDGALQQMLVFKEEIALHFGDDVANELEANFRAKDRELALENYQGLLVLNLMRRFVSAEQGVDDYAQAKLLLAKARGTFQVLSPLVAEKASSDTVKQIEAAFDKAIVALGNPGLFGVGKKEKNPEELKRQIDVIMEQVAPLFTFTINGTPVSFERFAGGHHVPPGAVRSAPTNDEAKINPLVSFFVVGGVLLFALLGIWLAKRKGLF